MMNYFLLFNVQGLCPQTKPSKVPYIEELLNDDKMFIALTETWLNNSVHLTAELDIDGYRLFRSDRDRPKPKHGRLSGGVCLYVKNDVAASFETTIEFSNGVVELLCIFSKALNLCIVVVYRQPDQRYGYRSQAVHFKSALDSLTKYLKTVEGCSPEMILCGDFNVPNVVWYDGLPKLDKCSKEERLIAQAINELCVNYGLSQFIDLPTHRAGNMLDLVFASGNELCHNFRSTDVPDELSHHKLIEVSSSFCFGKKSCPNTAPPRKGLFKYNLFDETVDWNAVIDEFNKFNWDKEFDGCDVDAMIDKFMDVCEEVCSYHIPLKPSAKGNARKKIPRDRRILMRRRRKLNSELKRVETSLCRRSKINKMLVGIEKDILKSQSKSRIYQETKAVQAIRKNSKFFFAYVNKMSKSKSKVGPLLNGNEKYSSDPQEMANILSKQFSSVFSKIKSPLISPTECFPDVNEDDDAYISNISFTKEDIIKFINELCSTSACGPDGVATLLLKKCSQSLCNPLYLIYRKSLDSGTVPKSFKISNITPIFKSGNKGLAVNYRPVALTSQLSKVFEKIIRNRLLSFFDSNAILNDSQHGFRSGRSCVSQLIAHFEKVIEFLSQGSNVDVVYLDFSKAFDKLDFNILLAKLKKYGVAGKLGRWIHAFLTGRQQFVTVDGFVSALCEVFSGVPQGSVLGPLLFLIMINDIDENIKNAFLSSFADDTRMGMSIKSHDDVKTLQNDLDVVYQWAEDNNMILNSSKFELLQYGDKNKINTPYSYLSSIGKDIVPQDTVKDLGVQMSANCSFSCHIETVISRVNKMVSWALRNFACRSKTFILTIWKTILLPHLDYCSQLWSPSTVGDIKRLELVQKCFIKKMNSLEELSYWEILKELGLYSLQRRRERYRIIYLWSILENLVPNPKPGQIFGRFHQRHGRFCNVPVIENNVCKNIVLSSFAVHSGQLFNCLPKEIRDLSDCGKDTFKNCLDNFLKTVPDEPQISGYTKYKRAESNSLIDMVKFSSHEQ